MITDNPQTMAVMVTNKNRFPIRDRFDGREYVFVPDYPTEVPIDAANHIFGWFPQWTDENDVIHKPDPVAMRLHLQRRWGWNTQKMEDKADIFFDKIEIKAVQYRMVPIEDEEIAPNPLKTVPSVPDDAARRPNKLMQAVDEAAARRPQV